ncbi:thioredoxin family protein [Methylocapsa sp. S129]|uniref:DUF1223 domain-containing protein n=1 Tax=Methylocapsa sp. S129 TaxID=1641869 RepID=UPI00131D2C23|nr:DUF1223 domain-containing protein [Methylocapsa sp. S129]
MFAMRAGAIIIGVATSLATPGAANAEGVRNVLELFTSQGCSSCPPADRILGELARDPSTLALSFPVDYWDYIGWKDTLATPTYTARQKAYASASGKGQVYTPQLIVNGLADVVGSDLGAIEQAERTTVKQSGVLSVPLSVVEQGGKINISVGAANAASPRTAGVYLLAFASSRTVVVQRGENAGSTLTYANVVRAMTKIGDWNGVPVNLEADLAQARLDGADSYAVIVQAGARAQPSAILAAARGP